MAKVHYLLSFFYFFSVSFIAASQNEYSLRIVHIDSAATSAPLPGLRASFSNKQQCHAYILQIVPLLHTRGYVTASVDSIRFDSTAASIHLFAGQQYKWQYLSAHTGAIPWLQKIGWDAKTFNYQVLNYQQLEDLQHRMLTYLENNGYPFAKIFLDSIQLSGATVSGSINIATGPLYKIDSIKVIGDAKISSEYLQNFLGIKNGSPYNKERLLKISSRLKQLNYVEETYEPKFYWGSTGGVVELFLQQKKSSQINFIIGLQPNNDPVTGKKMMLTGEGLLNLTNALGAGERIGFLWQKLQPTSQRLNVSYQHPYFFNTPLGFDFSFNMLKRDSAFLNFDFKLGAQFFISANQYARLFVQQFNSILAGVNTAQVQQTRQLPDEADVRLSCMGLEYGINTTNYMYNPVSGIEIVFTSSAGEKKIKPNSQVLELKDDKDPGFNFASLYDTVTMQSYQFKSVLSAAKYFPLGSKMRSTVKAGINGGYVGGSVIFKNELFQIGGYRLLRGFDEQSQFLSQYGIGTLEYRYLAGQNSYFNVFVDGGWGRNASRGIKNNYTYISTGLGVSFETKVGLFNLAWAVGKRNDTRFNLRQSKIHFGFINYF